MLEYRCGLVQREREGKKRGAGAQSQQKVLTVVEGYNICFSITQWLVGKTDSRLLSTVLNPR